jgi:AraC-like DNA-binding protein
MRTDGPETAGEHTHRNAHFFCVLEGRVYESSSEGTHIIGAGELFFRPPRFRHMTVIMQRSDVIAVELAPAATADFCPLFGSVRRSIRLPLSMLGDAPSRIAAELEHAADPSTSYLLRGYVFELIAEAARCENQSRSNAGPEWLEVLLRHVELSLPARITTSQLAGIAGVSKSALARAFRSRKGMSAGDYVRLRRVEFAAADLRDTDHPLDEIAVRWGFFDQSHFCRAFRAVCGTTPGEYRRASRMRDAAAHPGR